MVRHTLLLTLTLVLLSGCGQQAAPTPIDKPIAQVEPKPQPVVVQPGEDPKKPEPPAVDPNKLPTPAFFSADEKQEKYETALNDALEMLAQRKLPEALVAMEAARGFDDNDFIRDEIAKVKQRLDQDSAAKTTVQNIESVLGEGKAAEAAKLSAQALKEFGDSTDARDLIKLGLQADALATVQKGEDEVARFDRLRGAGEAALAEKNLRAAALAFEQALAALANAALQQKLDGIRADLDKYDAMRARAAGLRRDPGKIEDALAALQAAKDAWDTLQVRQDLDEYTLALQKRRATLSVADFDLRADLGMPEMGRSVAEELLPMFKTRFDLVERSQVSKVLAELKLEQGLDDPAQQREVGKLARVRYLVLGSVYPLAGVTVQARLVDVKTGLVVQTAKIVAPTAQDVFALLPELARQLTMNDEDKMAYDAAQQQKFAKAPAVIAADAVPPPPPPLPAVAEPVVAADVIQAPPPAFGGLRIEVFRALPPPPAAGIEFAPVGIFGGKLRQRLLVAAIHRGDFFVKIGNFGEAQRQFEFALNLAPGNPDVLLRLDRIRPFFAPPVVFVGQPVFVARPRVAILNFLVAGDPLIVPPTLGVYTPQQLAPYFSNRFEIVDPGLVYWYMGSLGLTMNDLLTDPDARRWLGRAVGVRYFLLGTIEQTASFDVTTYLMDAEQGFLQGSGRVHARNPFELRLRLGELAQLTLMTPEERQVFLAQAQVQAYDALIFRGRVAMQEQRYVAAVQLFNDALQIRPGAFDALFFLAEADRLARVQALQQRRVEFFIGPQFAVVEVQRRQWDVARAADQQRLLALQQTAAYGQPERVLLLQQREQAQTALIRQAELSFKTKNFGFSVSVFESAVNIAPAPVAGFDAVRGDPWRALALARLEAGKQAQLVQAQLGQQQEAALRVQREQELAAARTQLAKQQNQLDAERLARLARDKQAYNKAMAEGQALLAKGNFEAASGAFLVAQRLNRTPLVDNLLEETNQRRAIAQGKTDAERKLLESKLQLEREKRKAAETEAKRSQELYLQALQLAQAALAKRDYVTAQAKFEAAGAVFKTDVVLTGLKQVAQARAQDDVTLKAKQTAEEKATRVKAMIADGQAALKGKQFADAVKTFQQAKQIAPDHIDVLAGLTAAEHGRDLLLAQERKQADDANRLTSFQRMLKSGQANMAAKQYDAAVANLTEAVKLSPGDATAVAALKQAEKARAGTAPDPAAQKNLAAYQKHISDGRFAMTGKRYDEAIKAFSEAQKLLPSDQAAKDLLGEAQKGKKDAADTLVVAAQKQAEALKRSQDVQKALALGRTALTGRDLAGAAKAFAQAKELDPTNPAVLQALRDLEAARTAATADTQKRLADFQAALLTGQKAYAAKDYATAVGAYTQATRLMPDDTKAPLLLKQVQQAWNDAKVGDADLALKQKLEQQKKTQFSALLKEAAGKMNGKQFAEAKGLYQEALKLYANEPAALGGLKDANQALADSTKTPPKDNKALYTKAMQDGAAHEKLGKHADAVKSYEAALQLMPKDAAASTGVRRAQFGLYMADGQRFLDGARYADAQREFEAALKITPNDPTAKKLLDKAKKMMK